MSILAGRRRRRFASLSGTYYLVLLGLLYLPLAILFIFSVNANTSVAFPLRGFTLEWYERLFDSPALLRAVGNSLIVALSSSVVATSLGTMIALLLVRFEFRARPLIAGLAVLPLIVPYVVLAVALLVLFRAADVPLSLFTVATAHVVVALPFVTLIVLARLVGLGSHLEDAAMDLGASYPATIRLVVLPLIAPAMVAAWLVAFTVSFDEVALALFLAGREQTFPVYLLGQLRFTATVPVLIAAAVLLMLVSLAIVLVAERIRRLR
ncbi:MAG TPA: ABC transporter permease [Candidatus Limnocylindria bacterium]|nr:ABC transporter permease [Candidatus Limnocylindria bacterium]